MAITSEPFSEFPNRSNGDGDSAFSLISSARTVSFSPSSSKLCNHQQFSVNVSGSLKESHFVNISVSLEFEK